MGWTMWRISWCDARRALLLVLLVPILFLVGCNILTQPDPGPPRTVPPGTPPDPNPDPNPNPNPNPDPSPGPGAAARAPYVQMLGRTSAMIVFRTAGAAPARVEYGTSTAYGAAPGCLATPARAPRDAEHAASVAAWHMKCLAR